MKKVFVWSLIAFCFLFFCYHYYIIDVRQSKFTVKCSFNAVTGLYCTGCGGQRAFHYLLHGEFLEALRSNFLIFLLPFFLYLVFIIVEVYIFKENKHLMGFMFSKKLAIITFLVLVSYTILRNIPYEPFTYLIPK